MVSARGQQPVVECVALTKVFADFWGRQRVLAVDKLDLDIRPGEVFGLLGPNGSGKSTTIKILLGLLYPTSGAARVFGRLPTDTAIKSRIGFMPEESYLYRYLNSYETLDYYGRLFKLDRHERNRRTEQLIEMVGLKRAGKRPVGTYSKGMARRIGLAQALINDPDLLILDEPTTGLDPIGTKQIKDVISTLAERGKTILLCSHLLADVEDVCHRVAIMYGGKRQALDKLDHLLERREVTQITTKSLDAATVQRIRDVVKQSGRGEAEVSHPRDRLEDLFMRVVGSAQRSNLATSGADSMGGVSSFLAGQDARQTGRNVVESLVKAGATAEELPVVSGDAPIPLEPAPRREVITQLVSEDPEAQPATVTAPVNAAAQLPKPDADVLNRLMNKPGE